MQIIMLVIMQVIMQDIMQVIKLVIMHYYATDHSLGKSWCKSFEVIIKFIMQVNMHFIM